MPDELERLREHYERAAAAGLVDVKFSVHGITEFTTAEELAAEVNAVHAAIEAGHTAPLVFNDRRKLTGEEKLTREKLIEREKESLAREVNALKAAVAEGKTEELDFGDLRWKE